MAIFSRQCGDQEEQHIFAARRRQKTKKWRQHEKWTAPGSSLFHVLKKKKQYQMHNSHFLTDERLTGEGGRSGKNMNARPVLKNDTVIAQ